MFVCYTEIAGGYSKGQGGKKSSGGNYENSQDIWDMWLRGYVNCDCGVCSECC